MLTTLMKTACSITTHLRKGIRVGMRLWWRLLRPPVGSDFLYFCRQTEFRLQVARLDRASREVDEDLEGIALVPGHTATAQLPLFDLGVDGCCYED